MTHKKFFARMCLNLIERGKMRGERSAEYRDQRTLFWAELLRTGFSCFTIITKELTQLTSLTWHWRSRHLCCADVGSPGGSWSMTRYPSSRLTASAHRQLHHIFPPHYFLLNASLIFPSPDARTWNTREHKINKWSKIIMMLFDAIFVVQRG